LQLKMLPTDRSEIIYLDYNSTTPTDPLVLEEMLPYFTEKFANASSNTHFPGREAGRVIESARKQVADFINCEKSEIIFTSGATESLNLALKGAASVYKNKGNHIITWQTEHKAVLDSCSALEKNGFEITRLPVGRDGLPDLSMLEEVISERTIMVAMMLANNETGVIMPFKEMADIAHRYNAITVCDATQAPGKMRIDVNELHADLLTISSHKMYGPKGAGALFIRRKNPRVILEPLSHGGGHENGMRSGTYNVPAIAGFGKAAELATSRYWEDTAHMSRLRTLAEQLLTSNGMGYVNGSIKNRIPNTTNITLPGLIAEKLISQLPQIAIATGSACSSALPEPSHVLTAMGISNAEAYSSIRISIGRITTEAEIINACNLLIKAIHTLKGEINVHSHS
jgi:cysteine desulfurase